MRKTFMAAAMMLAFGGLAYGQDTATPQAGQEGARAEASQVTNLETVTVTVNKRDELIQTVPSSVTAVSNLLVAQVQATDLADVAAYVPGLDVQPSGGDANRLVIRGLSTGPNDLSPSVGVVVDDVPFGATSGFALGALFSPDVDPADVERVEVLRGPQGTLYGASTLGGLVKYVTRDPNTNDFQAHLRVDYGHDQGSGADNYITRAGVNLPVLSGVAGLRISAYSSHADGAFTDVRTGVRDLNGNKRTGGRMELLLAPTDALTVKLAAMFGKNDTPRTGQVTGNAQTLQPLYGEYAGYNDILGNIHSKYSLYTANVEYRLPPDVTFTSITGWSHFQASLFSDLTATFQPALGALGPLLQFSGVTNPDTDKLTQEFRLTSASNDHFEWQGGLFYDREASDYLADTLSTYMHGATPPAALAPTLALLANYQTANLSTSYKEVAAFANGTYYLTPDFDIGAGLRFSRNEQDLVRHVSGYIALIGATPAFGTATSADNVWTESLTARWRFNPSAMVYTRVANGYRPGGPNTTGNSFAPDKTWNYELGLKGSAFGGALQGSVVAYYIDWNDIQLNFFNGTNTVIGNAGDARSQGVEAEGIWNPARGLQVAANLTYSDAKISKLKPGAQGGAVVGDELPYNSKWAGALRADYRFPLSSALEGNLGAGLRAKSAFNTTFPNDTGTRYFRLPSASFLDLRAGLAWDRFDLGLQVLNVTDKRKLSMASEYLAVPAAVADALGQPVSLGYTPGRTYGLSLNVKL